MRSRRLFWTGVLIAMHAAAVAPAVAADPTETSIEQLRRSIAAVLSEARIPGAGIALVTRDRVIWAGGVGKADNEEGRDVDADTVFRLGSTTKSFVALALLRLSEQGRVDLEARLCDVAPELRIQNAWEETRPVRISHVLEHTAGFDDVHFSEMFCESSEPTMFETLALNPRSWRVRWPPGTRMSYSNPGYAIAGYLIEKSAGQSIDDYLAQAILRPLDLRSTTLRMSPEIRRVLARGYSGSPPRPVPYRALCLRASGGLLSSPRDMAAFVRFLLNRGAIDGVPLLRPGSIARMETAKTLPYERLEDAYGLGNYGSVDLEFPTRGHGGRTEGFHSRYRYSCDLGVGYALLFNADYQERSLEKIESLVFRYLTRDRTATAPSNPPFRFHRLSEFAGYYRFASPRRESLAFWDELMKGEWITIENGGLYHHRLFGPREIWIPTGARTFRKAGESGSSVLLTVNDEGRRVLIAGRHYYEKVPASRGVFPPILFFGGVLLMLSAPGFALFWVPRCLFTRSPPVLCRSVEVLPLLAVLSLTGAVLSLSTIFSVHDLSRLNLYTLGIFCLTWAFAVLSCAGLLRVISEFSRRSSRGVTLHALFVSLANCGFSAYLLRLNLIGLRVWEF